MWMSIVDARERRRGGISTPRFASRVHRRKKSGRAAHQA
jgi:hypothetical protein